MAVVTLDHLKELAIRAKSEIAEVASAVADALEELNAQKPDKSQEVSATIPVVGWDSDTSAYPKYYDFIAIGVTAADEVIVNLDPDSVGIAVACGLCPTVETQDGKLRFRSLQVPTSAIAMKYRIQDGKE